MTRVGIAGLGLIGGSLVRGLAEAPEPFELLGYDPLPAAERAAREAGFRTAPDVKALGRDSDIVIVAAPPASTPALVVGLLGASPALVVADAASAKQAVLSEVAQGAGERALARFVPAHPLAGAESAGWEGSDPRLLARAVWAVCPPAPDTPGEPLALFSRVVEGLEGRILVCSAADHDQAVARTSHVPHLAAQALARMVAFEDPRLRAALSGGGYRDMTRVAASQPGLWREILRANRAASIEALDELAAELARVRAALARDDGEAVEATWTQGASLRRLVEEVRWGEPAWEQASAPWPCWDELLALGRQGRAVRRLRLSGASALSFQAARETPRGGHAHEYDRGVIATSEYELLTESAGLVDRPDRAQFVVRGTEAAEFLQGQVSNDAEGLAPGSGCYAVILNHKGKLRTDLRILRGRDFYWLDTEAIGHAVVKHMLATYTLGRDVQWEDRSADHAVLSLIGPAADRVLDQPPPPVEHSFTDTGAGLWVRTDLGIDLLCSSARADELRAELDVEPVSEAAAECVRIESGRPRLGFDMDAETMPQEAGINERAVSFSKGCYVGQETVARLHWRGKPNRHLRGLRLSEPAEPRTEIMLGDKQVGRIASTCVSPRLGPIALALVRREAAPGDRVLVAGAEAEVVELPFDFG